MFTLLINIVCIMQGKVTDTTLNLHIIVYNRRSWSSLPHKLLLSTNIRISSCWSKIPYGTLFNHSEHASRIVTYPQFRWSVHSPDGHSSLSTNGTARTTATVTQNRTTFWITNSFDLCFSASCSPMSLGWPRNILIHCPPTSWRAKVVF